MKTLTLNKQTSCSDLEVWRAFKGGDDMAYTSLYQRYVVVLYQYAYKIAGDADTTKVCVQDLFIELWKNRSRLGEPESVRSYLLKSIRRKAVRCSSGNKQEINRLQMTKNDYDGEFQDRNPSAKTPRLPG